MEVCWVLLKMKYLETYVLLFFFFLRKFVMFELNGA